VGAGYVDVTAGVRGDWLRGALAGFARVEAGYHPVSNVDLFAFGDATLGGSMPGWQAGLGARVHW